MGPDGRRLWVYPNGNRAVLWDIERGCTLGEFRVYPPESCFGFSDDGRKAWLVDAREPGKCERVLVLEAGTGRVELNASCAPGATRAVVSPDAAFFVVVREDGLAELFDAATGKAVSSLGLGYGGTTEIRFSADGKKLLLDSAHWSACMYDIRERGKLWALPDSSLHVVESRFLRDRRLVVLLCAGPQGNCCLVLDALTGQEERVFENLLQRGALSADGRLLASVCRAQGGAVRFRVWDTETGKILYDKGAGQRRLLEASLLQVS